MRYEYITYFVLALRRTVRKLSHASVFSRTLSCMKLLITQMIVGGVPNIDQKVLSCRIVNVYAVFNGVGK